MKFYPDIFDILDHDAENENDMDEKQKWMKLLEEFNLDYKFDNSLNNMQEVEEEEEEELDEYDSISVDDDTDDEVKR